MAQSGHTPIQLYYSTTGTAQPLPADLQLGELALNVADGKLYYKNLSNTVQLLVAAGTGGGTVTNVNGSGGTTGLTLTGGPITSTGTLTLGGTLAAANGGTGNTSYTDGQLLIGNTSTGGLTKATLTAGANVTITNAGGSITIASTGGGGGGVTSVSAVSPVTSTGGSAPTIGFISPGAANNVLASNGTNWVATQLVPTGVITLWYGSIASIPTGWLLCNGTNGTPDLRDRFIVGAGSTYAVAATGGSANATLVSHDHTFGGSGSAGTSSALGSHAHTYSGTTANAGTHTHGVTDPGHFHSVPVDSDTAASGGSYFKSDNQLTGTNNTNSSQTFISINSAGDHNHTFSGTTAGVDLAHSHSVSLSISGSTSTSGSSATNANLPPYYALAYIMKA